MNWITDAELNSERVDHPPLFAERVAAYRKAARALRTTADRLAVSCALGLHPKTVDRLLSDTAWSPSTTTLRKLRSWYSRDGYKLVEGGPDFRRAHVNAIPNGRE